MHQPRSIAAIGLVLLFLPAIFAASNSTLETCAQQHLTPDNAMQREILKQSREIEIMLDLNNVAWPTHAASDSTGTPLFPRGSSMAAVSVEERRDRAAEILHMRYFCPTNGESVKSFFDLDHAFVARAPAFDPSRAVLDGMKFANLRLALWGLLDYNGYRFIHPDFFAPIVQRNIGASVAPLDMQRMTVELPKSWSWDAGVFYEKTMKLNVTPRKTLPLMLYSFIALGQRSIPTGVASVRQKVETIVSEAVHTRNGLFTPVVAVAIGESILELNRAFATYGRSGTKYFLGSRVSRAFFRKSPLFSRLVDAVRSHAAENRILYEKTMEQDADPQSVIDAKKRMLGNLAHLTYLEAKFVTYLAYETLLTANVRMSKYDPFHFARETKFDARHSRFMKTMSYYGRLFLRAGSQAYETGLTDDTVAEALKAMDVIAAKKPSWFKRLRRNSKHQSGAVTERWFTDRIAKLERQWRLVHNVKSSEAFPGIFPSESKWSTQLPAFERAAQGVDA